MHIHILGICGTFMGGIAVIAREAGHRVTGCDVNVYPPMSTQLAAQGIELIEGYAADQAGLGPDVFLVGNVITRGNPLMEAILNRGLPYNSGPQWLSENVLRGRWVLSVAGTHGKTTVASMLAWILEESGLNPGFLVGGVPNNFGVSARLGPLRDPSDPDFAKEHARSSGLAQRDRQGEALGVSPFVIEADEYDTAFFDKRSKFVHYRSRTAVMNNLEFDHADIFPDLQAIESQFHHFVRTIPGNGLIVVNGSDANLQRVLDRGCWTPVEPFGSPAGWTVKSQPGGGAPEILWRNERQGLLDWGMFGAHNEMNALAAIAAARHCGVPPKTAIEALYRFRGVKRRMEVRGVVNGITVFDDFAHHPTAIAATLAALRARLPNARITAVLEPRSNTMKRGVMKESLAGSLVAADRIYCFSAGVEWDAGAVLSPLGAKAVVCDDFERLLREIVEWSRPGDHILIMSNGGFGGIHDKLLKRLNNHEA